MLHPGPSLRNTGERLLVGQLEILTCSMILSRHVRACDLICSTIPVDAPFMLYLDLGLVGEGWVTGQHGRTRPTLSV